MSLSDSSTADASGHEIIQPGIAEATSVWATIGLLSFGGPAAQIALMHRLIVDEKRWLSERQYLDALGFCMLLPGPEAMQLATYAGWRLHGLRGGLIAGLLFVVPGALLVLLLSSVYVMYGKLPIVETLFLGVQAAVLVIVVQALIKVAKRALDGWGDVLTALAAFIALFVFTLPFPIVIAGAALFGWLRHQLKPAAPSALPTVKVRPLLTLITIGIGLTLWWLPVWAVDHWLPGSVLSDIGRFFSTLAVVTFGGAYAVLAYLAQDVVNLHGWLSPEEMIDGLGLAETTPGPLILVTEFVGFIAGFRHGGWQMGVAGAAMTLWVTFIPCFLWIFAGAPWIEWLNAQPRLRAILSAITAAVVGVMLNLSLWFAVHVLFGQVGGLEYGPVTLLWPDLSSLDWQALIIAVAAAVLTFWQRWPVTAVLGSSAVLALLLSVI
ncbi:MAG: chromate efflux transporter [Granulosicoccus sp.]